MVVYYYTSTTTSTTIATDIRGSAEMYLPKAPSALLRLLGLDDEDYCCYWLVSWSFPVLRTFVNVTEHHQDTTFLYVCNEEFMPQIDGIKVLHQQ